MNNPLKQYDLDSDRVVEYKFDSLNSFLEYIENSPITETFEYNIRSESGSFDFTKTRSLSEAITLCRNGCDENFDKFLKLKEEVSKSLIKPLEIPVIHKDVVGYAPSVSDFLSGSPLNMWNKTTVQSSNNVIDIYVQLAYSGTTKVSQIYNRGAITLSLIDALEKSGYAVNLYAFDLSYEERSYYSSAYEYLIAFFKLKDCSRYLNEKIAFFPLCHPSFLRRCIFRLTEVAPLSSRWTDCYGKVVHSIDTMKKFIHITDNAIIIPPPIDLRIRGNNLHEDLTSMLEALEIQKYFKRV